MKEALWVGLGGFLGAVARFWVSGLVHRHPEAAGFPWGTLVVNVVGCAAIGLAQGLGEARGLWSPAVRLFLFLGLLGGFTTFSSFAYETLALSRSGELLKAAVNVGLQVSLGLVAAWASATLGRSL
jgi:CrcB protein